VEIEANKELVKRIGDSLRRSMQGTASDLPSAIEVSLEALRHAERHYVTAASPPRSPAAGR
jgi:hypothetical protein